jgi:putative membrane protein
MLSTVVLPWLHYVAIMMMAGAAVAELYLLKLSPNSETVRLLPRIDRFYGINAGIVFVTGVLRMYHGGKGADWYWSNGLMHGVISAFVVAALISLLPTVRFIRWNNALSRGDLPGAGDFRSARILVHVQLMLLALVALLITLVAKGYGGH